jgi:hypothetical protein
LCLDPTTQIIAGTISLANWEKGPTEKLKTKIEMKPKMSMEKTPYFFLNSVLKSLKAM